MLKICGVRDTETALFAAQHGATAIGLVFADSPRCIDTSRASEIANQLQSDFPEVIKVAVLRERDLTALPSILQQVRIDLIQVHGEASSIDILAMGDTSILPVFNVQSALLLVSSPQKGQRGRVTILIDSPNGAGLGQPWDYSQARKLNDKFKVILAGGLNPNNVAQAIQHAHPHGVDVSSGVESSKGVKDNSMIKDFLQTAKSALQTIENTREICRKL